MTDQLTGAQAWSRRWRTSAPTPSSASPAGRSCRRTTRCSTRRHPPHPGPARAGGRARRRGLRDGHRPGRRLHGHQRARGPPTWSPPIADAYMDSVPDGGHHRPGAQRARSAPTPSRRPTSPASRMPITKHNYLVTDPARHPARDRRGVPHRQHRPARAGARRHLQGRAPGADRLPTGRRPSTCPATGRSPSRTPSRSARPPG